MKIMRVMAVGFLVSAFLIYTFAIDFYKWELNEALPFMFLSALNSISSTIVDAGGMKLVVVVAYIVACLGIGFLISATIYSVAETAVVVIVSAVFSRKESTEQTKTVRQRYFSWLPTRWA